MDPADITLIREVVIKERGSEGVQKIRPPFNVLERTDSHTNILFDAKIHVAANFRFRAYIRLRFSHNGEYLLQNMRLEANIRKTLSEFHIQANIRMQIFASKQIFACKYSHTSEYSLYIDSHYLGKPFTSLRPQLIFGSI